MNTQICTTDINRIMNGAVEWDRKGKYVLSFDYTGGLCRCVTRAHSRRAYISKIYHRNQLIILH